MSAREDLLARIRAATAGVDRDALDEVAERARVAASAAEPGPGAGEVVDRFAERVDDYRATVTRVPAAEVASAVAAALARGGAEVVVAPSDLPAGWCEVPGVRRDLDAATAAELDEVHAVVTGCAVAIAETGTIVLDGGVGQGRRALTLVPDHHVCVVEVGRIEATVGAALRRIDATAPLTWISGPSATSDIELDRVEGVHGPRRLDVIVVE